MKQTLKTKVSLLTKSWISKKSSHSGSQQTMHRSNGRGSWKKRKMITRESNEISEETKLFYNNNNSRLPEIDPRGRPKSRPVMINIFTHAVRPSVRPKTLNQATIPAGRDCGLAEWIIDDSCLVIFSLLLADLMYVIYVETAQMRKNDGILPRRSCRY